MIDIKETSQKDAYSLTEIYAKENVEYKKYFTAFSNFSCLDQVINQCQKDLFYTLRFQNEICGIYFLRGFDEGYLIPSFGVYVAERFSGLGLAKLALNAAITKLKERNIKCMMLKVDKQNTRAYKLYTKTGFFLHATCDNTGQDILYLDLP